MTTTSHSGRPPLQEAIVEFEFVRDDRPDLTVFGRLYDKISARFPDKEREVIPPFGDPSELPDTMRFYNEDRTALVRVGDAAFSVHHVNVHPGWNALRAFALDQLNIYREVVGENEIQRASVRYVNLVRLPAPQSTFSTYFRLKLPWPDGIADSDEPFRSLYIQAILPYTDDSLDLHLYLAHVPTEDEGTFSYVLDLIAVSAGALDDVEAWLERAHNRIRLLFERAFTNEARVTLFGETP